MATTGGAGVAPLAWPLVGRDAERDFLRSRFDEAPHGCVITGDSGVGKTRLLHELAEAWAARGGIVESVVGTMAARSMSLGATAQLVAPVAGISEIHALLHTALGTLEARSDEHPVAMFVDDAQFLDDASAVLVHLIATRSRVPTFVGVRTGAPAPDPIVALWKDRLLPRLEIDPLDESRTSELLAVVVPDLSDDARARLWHLSQGNALFLHELVALAVDEAGSGALADATSIAWQAGSAARLRELVEARMGMLAPDLFETLELVAVSEPLPTVLAERLASAGKLEDLERRALITVAGDGGISTAHPLHGEAMRGAMGTLRRRSLLRRLAAATERTDGIDPIRVATWRLEAGDRDPDLFAAASRAALRRLDYPLAERLSRMAVDCDDPARELGVGLTLSTALMGQERSVEAEQVLQTLKPDDDMGIARVAITRATNLFRGLGRPSDAIAVLTEVEAQLADPAWLAECRSVQAMLQVILWQTETAVEIATQLLDDPATQEPARLRAVFAAATVWMHGGQTERALDLTATWLSRTRAWRQYAPLVEVQLAFVRFYTYLLAGRLDEARAYAEACLDLDHAYPPPGLRAIFALARGAAAVSQGRHTDALAALTEAGDALPETDWFYNQEILRHAYLERVALLSGEIERARELAAQRPTTVGHDLVGLYERPLCDAWLAVADGRLRHAMDGLTRAAGNAAGTSPLIAAALYREAAGLGHATSLVNDARELAERVEHPLTCLVRQQIEALAADDGTALEQVAAQYETLGHLLWATETYAQAARCFAAAGRGGAALGAGERSNRLHELCGRPSTPFLTLAGTLDERNLTPREREIALLAANGTSNADLAAALHVSVHTVHTHLTRIYRKLGVTDRHELAEHLNPPRR